MTYDLVIRGGTVVDGTRLPRLRAEGYRWILVNGEVTFEDGEATGATPGQLLRNREVAQTTLGMAAG